MASFKTCCSKIFILLALMVMSSLCWRCVFIVYILETDMFYMRQTNKRSSSFVNQLRNEWKLCILPLHSTSAYIIRHDSLLLCLVAFVNGKKDTEIFVQRTKGWVSCIVLGL